MLLSLDFVSSAGDNTATYVSRLEGFSSLWMHAARSLPSA